MDRFIGREGERERLAAVLDGLGPGLTIVRGREGVGTTALVARGVPTLNMLFHSSELIPEGSPYNRTKGDVDRFFDRLTAIFDHIMNRAMQAMKKKTRVNPIITGRCSVTASRSSSAG